MAGSVCKRNGIYQIRYDLPPGPDGKRRQKQLSCKGMNKKQAEEKLRQILGELYMGTYAEPTNMTLSEYLKQWLEHKAAYQNLSPTTLEGYEQYLTRQIEPRIGYIRLDKLRPAMLQHFYDELLRSGRVDGGALSAKTVRNIHGMIHSALARAVRLQMIFINPADAVEQPRYRRPDIQTADAESIGKLLAAIERSKYRMPIYIALGTGCRLGEVLGLRWDDLDPIRHTLTIQRSIAQVKGRVFAKPPKNGKPRVVLLDESQVQRLLEHRRYQERCASENPIYRDEGWICADVDGTVLTPGGLDRGYGRMAKAVGVTCTMHGLRHTHATELILAGVPAKIVSERLGHSTTQITQDIYTHVMPHHQAPVIDVVHRLLNPNISTDNEQACSA